MAESAVPAQSAASAASSTRRLPYMSPRRPRIGVATDALIRKATSTQLAWPVETPIALEISGIAGIVRHCTSP